MVRLTIQIKTGTHRQTLSCYVSWTVVIFHFLLAVFSFATGDGVLNKAEYVNLISSYMIDPEVMKAELREAFMTFDKAKKGYLNLEQMTKALRCLGEPLSDIEIKQLMEIADTNHDGKVDVDGEKEKNAENF